MSLRRIGRRADILKCFFISKPTEQIIPSKPCNYTLNRIIWNNSQESTKNHKFRLLISLAFLWPAKKNDAAAADADEVANNDINNIIKQADDLFEKGHYDECYQYLSNSTVCKDVEAQWRICRALYNMSKDSKYDKCYRKDLVYLAYDMLEERLEENWDNYAIHKWYALLLDAKSSYEGVKERIKQLENVKKHMDLAVTINPEDATTLHMLGEWCYQVAALPWHQRKIAETLFASLPQSTYEDALEYFLRAEAVQPRFYSLNLLRLGDCYLHLKKEDQSKYYLKLAASYPAKSNDDHRANKEAAELLKKFKYKNFIVNKPI